MKFEEHPGWERTVPKYKAARDLHPSANDRFKFEPPFTDIADSDEYQYATHPIKAGQEIQTRDWPHPSLVPQNFAGQKILEFFNRALKSRLPRSPFGPDGRFRLDDGLSGAQPTVAAILRPRPAA